MHFLLGLIARFSLAGTQAAFTPLPLNGTITDLSFSTSVNISYGYLTPAKALFINATVYTDLNSTSIASRIGFVEFDIMLNSTFAQTYQFSVTPTGLCTYQGLLNLASNTPTRNANPSTLYVTSFTNVSSAKMIMSFQIAPIDATTMSGAIPTLSLSVGPASYVNTTAPSCDRFSSMRLNMIDEALTAFAPLSSSAQINSASTSCTYGSPSASGSNPCSVCFSPYSGTVCDQMPTTSINVTTNMTTAGPIRTTTAPVSLKTIITATLGLDIGAFDSAAFITDTAAFMNITNASVVYLGARAGSVIVQFYFSDAAIAASPTLVTSYLAKANQNNTYTKKYNVVAVSSATGEGTAMPTPSTAAPIGSSDDSGLSRGQVAILVIVIIVIVVIIIVAIVVYVKRSKDGNSGSNDNGRGNTYQQGQQMTAIGAQAPPASAQKPTAKPGGPAQPSYDI